ncbi:MAG: GH36 C-terminal domain-containing protein, partial [Planctomycetota bacterium]|jgi:hypothetical protein
MAGSTPAARAADAVRLRGLDPEAAYVLHGDRKGTMTGRTLMNIGLPWFLRGDFRSGVVVLEKQ